MATILDYLPQVSKPRVESHLGLHSVEGIATLVLGVVLVAWAIISFAIVCQNGSSFFDRKNGCSSGYQVIIKYSPPFWRTLTRWLFPSLLLGFLAIAGYTWHKQASH